MHWIVQQLQAIDLATMALAFYMLGLGLVGGWALCQVTHKQRGIEVDRSISDNLPLPPAPVVVPDCVPDEWTPSVR
jgi:hypothetical protein